MNRTSLEKVTSSLVIILLIVLSLGFILMVGNWTFRWDLFTPFVEKILYFISFSMLVVILSSFLINTMINLSRLASFFRVIAQKLSEK